MKNKYKFLNYVLLFIVTITVLGFSMKDNFIAVAKEISRINIWWLIIALSLICGYWLAKALIIHLQVKNFKENYSFKEAFKLSIITLFFNAVTPFATGGQPFQVYFLKKTGVSITDGTNVVINDTIIHQIAVIILGIFALITNSLTSYFETTPILSTLVIWGFITNLLVLIFLFALAFCEKLERFIVNIGIKLLTKFKIVKNPTQTVINFEKHIKNFHNGASILTKNKRVFIKMVIINVIGLISLYLVPTALAYGMNNYNLTALRAIVSLSYIYLIGSFVPIPGGTGGLEYSFIIFVKNFISGSTLTALMLMWRFITYYLGMTIGAITLNFHKKEK